MLKKKIDVESNIKKKQPKSKIDYSEYQKIEEFEEKKSMREEKKISRIFVVILALISILGFVSIILQNLFEINIESYLESFWLVIMGVGFIIEASPNELIDQIQVYLDERNFDRITTLVIGLFALISGILSFPALNIEHFVFSAIKALVSFVAIIFIAIETWVIKK
jgi:uncharacterized membrane protein